MKYNKSLLVSVAASASLVASASAATLLTFDGQGANGTGIPEAYGDNAAADGTGITVSVGADGVVGTPDISLNWVSATGNGPGASAVAWDSYDPWNGRGAVGQTDYGSANPLFMDFVPASATVGVLVNSFDLDEFAGGGNSIVDWAILNGASTIVSGTWDDFSDAVGGNGGRTTINTGMTLAQAQANAGSTLSLRLNLVSGGSSYQALDNLAFDQVAVPEPSSTLLGLAGLGAMALRRKRA